MRRQTGKCSRWLWGIPISIVAAAVLAVGVLAGQHAIVQNTPGDYVVVAKQVNVRDSSVFDKSKVLGTLFQGETVHSQGTENGFRKVQAAHGLEGYCSQKYLKRPSWAVQIYLKVTRPADVVTFTNNDVRVKLTDLTVKYPDLATLQVIGQSAWGDDIYALVVGNPNASRSIMIQGGIHAREYATGVIAVEQAAEVLRMAKAGESSDGVNVAQALQNLNIWFIPLLNPDGAALAQQGLSAAPADQREMLVQMNNSLTDFSRWKANGRGVDLNANFDAHWQVKDQLTPFGNGYPGVAAFSESETQAVRALVEKHSFESMICYHSTGEVIYWYFGQEGKAFDRDEALAQALSAENGYRVVKPDPALSSVGGCKDWFVEKYGLPGFTVEILDYSSVPVTKTLLSQAVDLNLGGALKLLAYAAER